MSFIGLGALGISSFESNSPPVRNIQTFELKNGIYDEVHIRERTNGIDTSNVREEWQLDTILLAKFLGDLEAGNINNQGVQIEKFAIKRRRPNELNGLTLGYENFINDAQFTYRDYTQPNEEFIYSIVPVGDNGLEGQENAVSIESDFAGWFVVDGTTDEVLAFDKFLDNNHSFNSSLTQGRIQIDTLSKYPSFFYTDQEYHEFQLQGVFIPEEWQRSGNLYENILNNFIRSHKPFLVKGSSGEIYIADIHSPTKNAPQNTFKGYDYIDFTISLTEIMSYEDYMELIK